MPTLSPRLRRLLPAVWVMALLCAPAVLWVAGERQPDLENRPKTAWPVANRDSLRSPNFFAQADAALLERLPLREQALEVKGHLTVEALRDSPNPDVIVLPHAWLDYRPEGLPCTQLPPFADLADAADVLARSLVAAGRRAGVVIAGGKPVIRSVDWPKDDRAAQRCMRELRERVDARLAAAPGGIDVDAPILALQRAGHETFLQRDTHWNWRGREIFVRAVLDRIRPGLADQAGIRHDAPRHPVGDLAKFVGLRTADRDRIVQATRTPPNPPPAGKVVLVGDSQLEKALIEPQADGITPVRDVALPGQPNCNWPQLRTGGCDAQLQQAHAIIIEHVLREAQGFTADCWRPIALTGDRLHGAPGRLERTDGARQSAAGDLRLPASGQAQVRLHPASGPRSATPRLLRLPIEAIPGAQRPWPGAAVNASYTPQGAGPFPCVPPTNLPGDAGLLIPVPAGRDAGDVLITLQGRPGTRIGRPQEIVLDGHDATR